jgi:hypothetical protein
MPEYKEPGFPASGQVSATLASPAVGNATAVAPKWVLTCGHGGSASYFVQGKKRFKIKRRFDHKSAGGNADLALYELEQPVSVYSPILFAPFNGKGGLKAREFTLVGFGETGIKFAWGLDGRQRTGGVKRSATNRIDAAQTFTRFAPFRTEVLVYDLDQGGAKSLGTLGGPATAREGGIGGGDSGGAWYVMEKGKPMVVSVCVYLMGHPKGGPHAFAWGSQGAGVHLYAYRDWIQKTMASSSG